MTSLFYIANGPPLCPLCPPVHVKCTFQHAIMGSGISKIMQQVPRMHVHMLLGNEKLAAYGCKKTPFGNLLLRRRRVGISWATARPVTKRAQLGDKMCGWIDLFPGKCQQGCNSVDYTRWQLSIGTNCVDGYDPGRDPTCNPRLMPYPLGNGAV